MATGKFPGYASTFGGTVPPAEGDRHGASQRTFRNGRELLGAGPGKRRLRRHYRSSEVEFLITSAALAQMLNPDFDILNAETALEVFEEFESDIHRIAQLEFVKRLGGEPPILLTAADVEIH